MSFSCTTPAKAERIIRIFDIIARKEQKDYLGIAGDKTVIEKREIFWDHLNDKLGWTQQHGFENVWGYAHLLLRIDEEQMRATMHFLIDIHRKKFCSQIRVMLKELGANEVEFTERPAEEQTNIIVASYDKERRAQDRNSLISQF